MVMLVMLVTVGGLLLIYALLHSATVRQIHWQPTMVASGLLLIALVGYTIPIVTNTALSSSLQTDTPSQPSTINHLSLQTTLTSLAQSGSQANPAYTTLLVDYATYHIALVIEGGVFTFMLIGLSGVIWRRFRRSPKTKQHTWSVERTIYWFMGCSTGLMALMMFVIVSANLTNVVNPQAGFAQVIPDLGRAADSHKVALYQAVNSWVQEGNPTIPSLLQQEVANRLMWQQPKAIVCSILLLVFSTFSILLWQKLIRDSRSRDGRPSLKVQAQLIIGILAIPVTGLLMLMAVANTQASLAPITLTLLFS